MKKLLALISLSIIPWVSARDADPVNPDQILKELQDIVTKSEATIQSRLKAKTDQIFKAADTRETAIAFYEDAQMAIQFQGASREGTQLRDWKKKSEEQLKDPDFRESIRLHLFWLGLSLKQAANDLTDAGRELKDPADDLKKDQEDKAAEMVPKVLAYLNILENANAAKEVKQSLLKQSVAGGIFAQWLNLGPDLSKAKNWEMTPGNPDAIYAKIILPYWREQKNPAVIKYWDNRIAQATLSAGDAKLDFQKNNFATLTKPNLLWQRAQEFRYLDQPNRAIQEMFALIKLHSTHPDVEKWIAELQGALQPKEPATPVTPEITEPTPVSPALGG